MNRKNLTTIALAKRNQHESFTKLSNFQENQALNYFQIKKGT